MFQIEPSSAQDTTVPAKPPSERIFQCVTSNVARNFGLAEELLVGTTRGAPQVAFARQVAMYLIHIGFAMSFATIGRMFGRDRTTVAHACRVIEDGRDDARLDGRLAALERACRQNPDWQAVHTSGSIVGHAQ